ncbi:MAG: hypothetical protein AB1758_15610, partial [Candidatus Eremiobacterota bacterium]
RVAAESSAEERDAELIRLKSNPLNQRLKEEVDALKLELEAARTREERLERAVAAAREDDHLRQGEQHRLLSQLERLQMELVKAMDQRAEAERNAQRAAQELQRVSRIA